VEVIFGQAHQAEVLAAANLGQARALVVAIPDAFEAGEVVRLAHRDHPQLPILARAHSDDSANHLAEQGAALVVLGEREVARGMIAQLRDAAPVVVAEAV
jgi:CPA2 family monovalent cation:H+ antiporter-2